MPSHGEECANQFERSFKNQRNQSRNPYCWWERSMKRNWLVLLVEEEKVDGIVLGRASLADPDFVKKAKEHKDAQIAPCTGCLAGCWTTNKAVIWNLRD